MLAIRSRISAVAILLACCAGEAGARQASGAPAHPRDPDRGLDPALRAELALVDPARDSWAVEKWAALVDARLRVVALLWAEGRLEPGLAAQPWIAADLCVAPLFAEAGLAARTHGEWTFSRGAPAEAPPATRALAQELAARRAAYPGEARLEFEIFEIDGDERALEARIRVAASGALATGHLQHRAVWTSTWRAQPSGVELSALRAETFEAALLARRPRGLFEDVTESVLGEALHRREAAPGLDEWRASICASLEPGSLGHHGLALGDADGDGREDLYWCRPGGLPNKLLLHAPDDGVIDASAAAGVDLLDYSSGALFLDLDLDADADLLVATGSGLVFFANDGRARFERELFLERSLATSLAAADYDADGDLDVYVCSYVSPYERNGMPVPYHDADNGEENQLLRNDGEWRLVDATAAAGMDANNRRFSLAASWEDYDNDGDPDLYVANDFGRSNLYENDGGRFRDVAAELGVSNVAAGMGVTWGDVENDGWMDLYVTNLYSPGGSRLTARPGFRPASSKEIARAYRHHSQGNALYRNQRGAAFRDASLESGTFLGRWGWGSLFLDLDDDGLLDLFAPNGFVTGDRADLDSFFWRRVVLRSPDGPGEPGADYALGWRAALRLVRQGHSWNGNERNLAYLNLGRGEFADVSAAAGLDQPDDARAAARVDWDGDGDEDLIVANRTAPMLRFLSNGHGPGSGWIAFQLSGGERTAIGARVELETTGERRLVRTLRCGEGYLAQASARVHFGLGADGVRRVAVRWPGGEREDFGSPDAGHLHLLERGTARALRVPPRDTPSRLRAAAPRVPAPPAAVRTVLPTPLPLPRLALETWDGRPASLLGISMQGPLGTGQPLLLVPWSGADPACRSELARLVAGARALSDARVQVVALCVDEGDARARARAELAELDWPFGSGVASEEALAILEIVEDVLHDDARGLSLPAAFLVDAAGRLSATYAGRLEPERVLADLGLSELTSEARRDAAVPFAGRWVGPLPEPLERDVAARLSAHGLERPAAEYRLASVEVRELSRARHLYEQGVAAHRQARLAEAIGHYRRALESDPGYALAAQDLAVALHQQGELVSARAAYEHALQLEPGHARTRCNLGYLLLDLGDVAGARSELQGLRALQSEFAATLDARIREYQER
jgi:tetratricopeptide (TPR) repeat protein